MSKVNYTPEQVEYLSAYPVDATDDERDAFLRQAVEHIGKPIRSVRAKLSSMGLYKAPERKTKTGEPVETKAEVCDSLADMVPGLTHELAATLASGNKKALKLVRGFIRDELGVESDQEQTG